MTPIEYIWSDYYMVLLERKLWLRVMEYQARHTKGLVSLDQCRASRNVITDIDLGSIRIREMKTKHDVKARLEEFCDLSGHQQIHLGMTSADVVENVYLIRQVASVQELIGSDPKRFGYLQGWVNGAQFRGIRGPIGSDADQMSLFERNQTLVDGLSAFVAQAFGFMKVIGAVGQCMPRSFDLHLATMLMQSITDPLDLIMANGVLTMLAGQQVWLEGDVASSCVRRYAWPLLFSIVEGSYKSQDATTY